MSSLDDFEYIESIEIFTCEICLASIPPGDGIKLKNCLHEFCKSCISSLIKHSPDVEIQCPHVTPQNFRCGAFIQDRELRCFITDIEYLEHLKKSLAQAENQSNAAFHCRTPNCIGWVEIVGTLKAFTCIVCKKTNCIKCNAIHENQSCESFKRNPRIDTQKSQALVEHLIRERRVMRCPSCGILVQKISGCNKLKCLKCKHEFQWTGKTGFERFIR